MKIRLVPFVLAALVLTTGVFAQTSITPAIPPTPVDAAELNQQSIESLKNKDAKGAVELAEQATKADPTKPEYFSQLGIALSQRMNEVGFMQMAMLSGKLKKAFARSVELDPNHVPGLIGLTRFYTGAPEIAGGSLEKAAEFAHRVQQLNPFLGEIELGRVAEKGENFTDALVHFEAASKLQPENAGLHYACGQQLAKLGRKDEARARFETSLKFAPEHESTKKALAELNAAVATKS